MRAACLSRTTLSGNPFARAAITKSSRSTSSMLLRVRSMVPAKEIMVRVPIGSTMCFRMSSAKCPMPDIAQATGTTANPITMAGNNHCRDCLPPAFLDARTANRTKRENAPTVISMSLNTLLAATGASLHNSGSRNLPSGNQPNWNEKIHIIIRANHGVNMVKSTAPDTVAVYSKSPPRLHAISFPSTNPT